MAFGTNVMRLAAIMLSGAMLVPAPAVAQAKSAFVTLGTGGGPIIRLNRSEPANAVVVGDAVYLFDVGDGVQRQMLGAKLSLPKVRAVFVSHHHIDHNGDLAPLLVNRWLFNSYAPLPVIGPPGTRDMIAGIAQAYRATELAPVTIGGPPKPAIAATITATDLAPEMLTPTEIYRDENIRVLAVLNDHYHFAFGSAEAKAARSYAFRIETPGRTYVYTGDTGPSERLISLAKGADVLVTEVIDMAAIARVLDKATDLPAAAKGPMMAHMREDHLVPDAIGQLAAAAGVKEVVLTHIVPGNDEETDLSGYTNGIVAHFKGKVRLARDLDRF